MCGWYLVRAFFLTGTLEIGGDTWVGHEVLVTGGDAEIKIGKYCDIAPRVLIVSGSHKISPDGLHVAGEGYSLPISIGNGCWIGAGAVILGGTVLGEHTVVAAGAVVKGSFPDRCVVAGVPAKIIRIL
ncbi:acyltransferase [Chlorobium phaeovibrioides]|nr:acyltransferase [Chlorobium phaeovibrioides]